MGRFRKSVLTLATLALGLGVWSGAQAFVVQPSPQASQQALFSRFFYQAALQAASQGDVTLTNDLMGRVQRLNPDNLAIGVVYAEFLQYQKQYAQALSLYQSLLPKATPPDLKASMLYHTGMAHDALGQLPEAADCIEQAVVLMGPQTPYSYYYDLGVVYAKMSRYEDTLKWSKKAVEVNPNVSEAWNNIGFSHAKLGQLDEAQVAVEKSLSLDGGNANALDSMGYVFYLKGQYPKAIDYYQRAIVADPTMSESFLFLGKCFEATGVTDKALQAYESYLSIQEVTPQADVQMVKTIEDKVLVLRSNLPKTEVATPQPEGNVFLQMQADELAPAQSSSHEKSNTETAP